MATSGEHPHEGMSIVIICVLVRLLTTLSQARILPSSCGAFWGQAALQLLCQAAIGACIEEEAPMCREAETSQPGLEPGRKEPVPLLLIFTDKLLLKLSITGLKTNMLPAHTGLREESGTGWSCQAAQEGRGSSEPAVL